MDVYCVVFQNGHLPLYMNLIMYFNVNVSFCIKHDKIYSHEDKDFLFCVFFASYHIVSEWCVEVLFLDYL